MKIRVFSDLSKYEFLCPIYVKIIKFLVIWHHFDCFYVKKRSENPSKSTENSPKTRLFHRFWNYGLRTTPIWLEATDCNQFLGLLSAGENLLAQIQLFLSYIALFRQFLTVFGRILPFWS